MIVYSWISCQKNIFFDQFHVGSGLGVCRFEEKMSFKFEKLIVWQKALKLSEIVCHVTNSFPKKEVFGLSSQMQRAADSVSLNIAEGSTGQSNGEFRRFIRIALRSNMEVVGCIHIARSRGYINEEDFRIIYNACEEILVMLNSLGDSLS